MASTNGDNRTQIPIDGIEPPEKRMLSYNAATRTIHADDHMARTTDVAPAIHTSTTFEYTDDPEKLIPVSDSEIFDNLNTAAEAHIYSRLSAPNSSRLEVILSSILNGHAITYTSGLSAFHGLLAFLNPKHIAIGDGYHGCHGVVHIMTRLTGLKKLDLHNPSSWDEAGFGKGDLVHVETPLNPTGEAYNIEYYAEEAHKRGGYLAVDATLGPPGLQDPFKHGADVVMHSGTKYIGGHSDMLCGILATQRKEWWKGLYEDRLHLGAVMGNLEGWLGLRSLRTFELRVKRQAENAENLVQWLDTAMQGYSSKEQTEIVQKGVLKVQHASLQRSDVAWLRKQMSGGFGPVFAITMRSREMARRLPSKLKLFHHATSLGGVESLIEWRRMSDDNVDDKLLRVSVGIEDYKDLKADLLQAFEKVVQESS